MRVSDYSLQSVKCPFYRERQGDRYRIKCEGPVKNTTTQVTFQGDKRWYMKDFCCGNFERCRVYNMLCKKYNGS